jgi:hypothetical protein
MLRGARQMRSEIQPSIGLGIVDRLVWIERALDVTKPKLRYTIVDGPSQ